MQASSHLINERNIACD